LARDVGRAAEFYAEVIGWSPRLESPEGAPYSGVFLADDREIAAIMPLRDDAAPRSVWLPFVQCSDLGTAVSDVARLGGAVRQFPTDLPTGGRIAITADPSGALMGLLEKHEG
jgi:hypothetical protein